MAENLYGRYQEYSPYSTFVWTTVLANWATESEFVGLQQYVFWMRSSFSWNTPGLQHKYDISQNLGTGFPKMTAVLTCISAKEFQQQHVQLLYQYFFFN